MDPLSLQKLIQYNNMKLSNRLIRALSSPNFFHEDHSIISRKILVKYKHNLPALKTAWRSPLLLFYSSMITTVLFLFYWLFASPHMSYIRQYCTYQSWWFQQVRNMTWSTGKREIIMKEINKYNIHKHNFVSFREIHCTLQEDVQHNTQGFRQALIMQLSQGWRKSKTSRRLIQDIYIE